MEERRRSTRWEQAVVAVVAEEEKTGKRPEFSLSADKTMVANYGK